MVGVCVGRSFFWGGWFFLFLLGMLVFILLVVCLYTVNAINWSVTPFLLFLFFSSCVSPPACPPDIINESSPPFLFLHSSVEEVKN